jgi:hypothetical protein
MFIDNILNQLLRPFRELYSKWMSIRSIKGGIQGDIRRVQMLGNQVQGYGQNAVRVAGGMPDQMQQGWNAAQQQVAAAKPPGSVKKMSWFPWSKKTCPGCQQKLHKSWDQCPYCGMSQVAGAPPPQGAPPPGGQPPGAYPQGGLPPYGQPPGAPYPMAGGPQKTIAMDAAAVNAPLISTRDQGDNVGWLVPLEGAQTGELLQFNRRVVVGTAEGCDFKFLDASISGRHAELSVDAQGRFRITDLGSTNGSYVNDKKITSTDLVDGDNIRLGRTTFRFKTKS